MSQETSLNEGLDGGACPLCYDPPQEENVPEETEAQRKEREQWEKEATVRVPQSSSIRSLRKLSERLEEINELAQERLSRGNVWLQFPKDSLNRIVTLSSLHLAQIDARISNKNTRGMFILAIVGIAVPLVVDILLRLI
jgi:DNA repair exonuclease SbcCD ATPase subunit